jgi:hypothetical protein
VAAGCGCIVIVLIITGIVVAVMWKSTLEPKFMKWLSETTEQAIRPFAENAADDIADDPRVVERLGEPIKVTRDETEPFTLQNPHWKYKFEGSKESATGIVELQPNPGGGANQWQPTKLEITFEDGTSIDVLEDPAPEAEKPAADGETEETTGDSSDAASTDVQQPYKTAIARATSDMRVKQALGEPLREELVHGDLQPSRSEWEFVIHGANGNANGKASAESDGSKWKLNHAELTLPDGQTIDLMEEYGVNGVKETR